MNREEAERLLGYFAAENGLTVEELRGKKPRNKVVRDQAMREIRKRSNLTLSEMGQIFGGLSGSTVSKVVGNVI